MLLKSLFTSLFLLSYLLPFTTSFSNLPMETNTSAPKLQKRQDILLHSGFIAGFRNSQRPTAKIRTCTLGFAVKKTRGMGGGFFDHGYLTLSSCLAGDPRSGGIANVFIDADGRGTQLKVGKSTGSSAKYLPEASLNYAIVKVFPEFWSLERSMNIPVRDDPKTLRIVPVGHSQNPNPENHGEICFWGGYSHHVCGAIVTLSAQITRPRPWGQRNLLGQHLHDMNYFSNMGVVTLPAFTKAQRDNTHPADWGSPVYIPERDANNRIIRAYPTGLLDGYCTDRIVVETIRGLVTIPIHPHEACFFYQPLDRILASNPNLELIRSPGN